jgi:hypothetical protein
MKVTVESKKLHLIEEFLKIQNEDIINKIEVIINEERHKSLKDVFNSPFSTKELDEMIDQAEADAKHGRVYSTKDLKKQIQSWK